MLSQDIGYILVWWFWGVVISISFFPTCYIFFKKFTDYGYGFSKSIGILIISYLIFITSILHALQFNKDSLLFLFLILLIFNAIVFYLKRLDIIRSIRKGWNII